MLDISDKFKYRNINYNKLIEYGFTKENSTYKLKKDMCNNFTALIEISNETKALKIIDKETDEEYVLAYIKNANGSFVGKIKEEFENIINEIIDKCTIKEVFKNKQSKEIIKYIKDKYNDDLEYLWEKFPNTAIWRNKENNKWYGVLLTINESKLQNDKNNEIEILDIRYEKGKTNEIIDNKTVFPGYHMNKTSWITIKLDETIKTQEIIKLIDNSYKYSKNK